MKNLVLVIVGQAINVNGEQLNFNFENPLLENIVRLDWYSQGGCSYQTADGKTHDLPLNKYAEFVEPFVNLFEAEKQRIEEEKAAAEVEYNSFPNVQARKLDELKRAFNIASENAHCLSSVGFEIDANETANRNISGLILVLNEGETTMFRAYDNSFYEVTKEQLVIMQKEIVANSQSLYQRKWELETAINACQTVEELDDIIITFKL